jgi:site-specific DNA-cytosine methylase
MARENGYTMTYYFTSTHLHGVPQRRHRTFYFFWRENGRVPVMNYWHRQTPTWGEYLAQVPADATQHEEDKGRARKQLLATRFARWAKHEYGESFPEFIRERLRALNKTMMTVQDFVLRDPGDTNRVNKMYEWYTSDEVAALDPQGGKYVQRIIDKTSEGKGVWDDSPSIFLPETHFNALIGRTTDAAHPVEHRSLTVRECLHMMALPNDFNLVTKTINHICQNVPVCTGADMQRDVIAYLNGELPMVDGTIIRQNNFKDAVERIDGDSKLLVF